MTTPRPAAPALSRPVVVAEVPPGGLSVTVTATPAECQALAAFNGLPAVEALEAPLTVRMQPGGGLHVTGTVEARLTQTCVVSLEPFDTTLREPVDVTFLPPDALAAFRAERAKRDIPEDEEEDEPDGIEHGRIDLGALAAEHFTLGLDPYPRKPGAVLALDPTAEQEAASPFAVLKQRRENQS